MLERAFNRLWYGQSAARWWLAPLALLFAVISGVRRYGYRHGWFNAYRSTLPVLVVGNLSVGGNGKTPLVIWLAEQLRARGYSPAIVSRGYGASPPHTPFLVTADSDARQAGDEPLLLAKRTGCLVVIAPKRASAVQWLEANSTADIILTDDGLQHYALARDIEIVVVDGARRFGNGCLLPMGPLREPLTRLKRVQAVVCNGSAPGKGEYAMGLVPAPLRRVCDDALLTDEELARLQAPVDALAGIGYPPRFFQSLAAQGVQLDRTLACADHQAFVASDLLARFGDKPLIMTEKDAVKCRAFAPAHWWYQPVNAQIAPSLLDPILSRLPAR
ncbi:MAG: tetraacyldisaccharide 4'-kinase [Aeromonas sp.]